MTFPSVESVGPKVSGELIVTAMIAVGASLAAILIYIWLRFEWQFSVGAVVALIHDIALRSGLGMKLVLVPGARPQIEERLKLRNADMQIVNGHPAMAALELGYDLLMEKAIAQSWERAWMQQLEQGMAAGGGDVGFEIKGAFR